MFSSPCPRPHFQQHLSVQYQASKCSTLKFSWISRKYFSSSWWWYWVLIWKHFENFFKSEQNISRLWWLRPKTARRSVMTMYAPQVWQNTTNCNWICNPVMTWNTSLSLSLSLPQQIMSLSTFANITMVSLCWLCCHICNRKSILTLINLE